MPEIELDPAYRRQTPVIWPEKAGRAMRLNGRQLVATIDQPTFGGIHSRQSDASLQGAISLFRDLEAMLQEISGFSSFAWGSDSPEEALDLGLTVMRKAGELRQPSAPRLLLWIHSEIESAPIPPSGFPLGLHRVSAESLRRDMSKLLLYKGATVLLTNSAIEKLDSALGPVIATCRSLGSLCGLARTNLQWLAAGFWPPSVNLDFAILNLAPWCGTHGGLSVLASTVELDPFLPQPRWCSTEEGFRRQTDRTLAVGWNKGPIGQLQGIATCSASLRQMGAEGLKRSSQLAAIHTLHVQKRLALLLGDQTVASSLHEVWTVSGRQAIFHGGESDQELAKEIFRLSDHSAGR